MYLGAENCLKKNHCQVGSENNVMRKSNREPSGLAAEVDVGPGVCKQHLHHLRSHRHCQIVTKPTNDDDQTAVLEFVPMYRLIPGFLLW